MAAKIHTYKDDPPNIQRENPNLDPVQYWFHCPGCGNDHAFTVGPPRAGWGDARWTFDGDFERPTFAPSLLCNKNYPGSRCHCFVINGSIQFQEDCWHALKGKTVELPDWESCGKGDE